MHEKEKQPAPETCGELRDFVLKVVNEEAPGVPRAKKAPRENKEERTKILVGGFIWRDIQY
jgi:hypothetical protein